MMIVEVAMLMLSVGDEVVLTTGEDAGSIGEVLAVNYGACLGPQAQVKWHHGTTSWLAVDLLDELVDESARGLIDMSRLDGEVTRALHTPSLARFLGHEAGLIEYRDTFARFHGDDWTVILHHGAA
jgi:hypothetical protein